MAIRVQTQGSVVTENKRVTGANDVKDHVGIPVEVLAEVGRVVREALSPSSELRTGDALRHVEDLLRPWL